MALKWHELRAGREYIISHDKTIHTKRIYKGTFIERREIRGSRLISKRTGHFIDQYVNVSVWYSLFSINGANTCFFESDIYYDVEIIKKKCNPSEEKYGT